MHESFGRATGHTIRNTLRPVRGMERLFAGKEVTVKRLRR